MVSTNLTTTTSSQHFASDVTDSEWFVLIASIVSILFGLFNAWWILRIQIVSADEEVMALRDDKILHKYKEMQTISQLIADGAFVFLRQEYLFVSIIVAVFSIIIAFTVEPQVGTFYTVVPFILGAVTSIVSGYIGMSIAVKANVRACKEAVHSLHRGFVVAFRGGMVLGFTLVGLALLVLQLIIIGYKKGGFAHMDFKEMFENIAGYGLGGSLIALFGRVGGGIYTKAADVGSDLAGKVVAGLPEDCKENPGVIADNVGDNVGDIAGMGSDLFGSFAESTCACLVISATSSEIVNSGSWHFPLLISAAGIFVCIVTSFISSNLYQIEKPEQVEASLKYQLIFSTILMTPVLYYLA
jgi:H+-translocating diphosphatase